MDLIEGIEMIKLLFLMLLLFSQSVMSDCVCRCVNGEVTPLCSNTLDLKPICSPQICPIVPPSIQPITPPTIPPIGTTGCQNQQVFNPYTHQYEWKLICR